jgi:penicillin-binding protein 1B
VGFDDNRELDIEGAHSALPIWTEFMKRAITFRRYADAKAFEAPSGVVSITIDPESGMPAGPQCPMQQSEVFIAGTEPVGACPLHSKGGDRTTVTGWDTTTTSDKVALPPAPAPYAEPAPTRDKTRDNRTAAPAITQAPPAGQTPQPAPSDKPKKKGFFGKLKDIFR